MGLEAADFIPELDENNPLGGDPKSQGDDHIRLTKKAVKGSFPAFVGTTGTPKSVTLTEDEINQLAVDIATLLAVNPALLDAANTFLEDNIFEDGAGNEVANTGTRVAGSFLVRDIAGNKLKAGYRNPLDSTEDGNYTFVQGDEGAVIRKVSNTSQTYTVPVLEANTCITLINESANSQTIAVSGTTIEAYLGGDIATAPLTLARESVLQLYYVSTTAVRAWGNGIT